MKIFLDTSSLFKLYHREAKTTLELFEADCSKYTFIATDSIIIEQARKLTTKYGLKGLRTLDSIQLSTSIALQ